MEIGKRKLEVKKIVKKKKSQKEKEVNKKK